ncbi:hypothetical protein [uncultured Tateyamaria sp.]|uniref:hypothetical protein n=1 Tax=uncultured Tateyamaria sp. TaxID=455651 RepID=UPI0026306F87|nr:hypothetical protein [uncultured Tateyamaria sp.]
MMAFAERILGPLVHIRDRFSLTRLDMAHDGVLQHVRQARPKAPPAQVAAVLDDALSIPCPDPTAEERTRDAHQARGLKLARSEDWGQLTEEIAQADSARRKTPGGKPVAELMAYGARADVVGAAEHALLSGRPTPGAPLLAGIEALEQVLAGDPTNPILSAIVAQAHMDIGWAWRGTGWDIEVPARNREAFSAHFDRAADIVNDRADCIAGSPLLAATACALSSGRGGAVRHTVTQYETWIDLDPKNAQALRAFGAQLLPRWHGDYARLELEARRVAGRTHDIWGAGGYTWMMLDAISVDTEACLRVDIAFFVDGLHDILRHAPDQHTVNLLAAYCANTMGSMPTGHDETDYVRAQIAEAAVWIVRDHLTELHPMLWAHAARGFDNALRVRCADTFAASGYADALRYLTGVFRRELSAGNRVVFTDKGAEMRPG